MKITWDPSRWDRGLLETVVLLKGLSTDLFNDELIHFELQHRATARKSPETYGEEINYLASEREMLGHLFLVLKWWKEFLFLYWALSQPSLQVQVGTKSKSPSKSLHPYNSLRIHPIQHWHRLKFLWEAVTHKWPSLAHATYFPKISERPTSAKQAAAGLCVPFISCYVALIWH